MAVNLLSDLNGACWLATVATLVLCACIFALVLWNRRNGWAVDLGAPFAACLVLGFLCLAGAFGSYSRYDGVSRKTVAGVVHIVHITRGRHSWTEYICADTCQASGGYALSLDWSAAEAIDRYPKGTRFRFTYPDQPKGGVVNGVSLVVESIAEADSGAVIYQKDLLNHPFRIAFYLADLALIILTLYISIQMSAGSDRPRSESHDDSEEPEGGGPEQTTSLHLE